jgi:hypothetical protein
VCILTYSPTLLLSYSPTLLLSYSPTLLLSYSPTLLLSYSLPDAVLLEAIRSGDCAVGVTTSYALTVFESQPEFCDMERLGSPLVEVRAVCVCVWGGVGWVGGGGGVQ